MLSVNVMYTPNTRYQAESDLTDKAKREELDAIIHQSRSMVLKSLSLPTSISDDDDRLKGIDPPFKTRLRLQSKDLLIEEEVRRRKYECRTVLVWRCI